MQNSSITIKQALIRPHHLIPEPEIDPVIAFEFRVVEIVVAGSGDVAGQSKSHQCK